MVVDGNVFCAIWEVWRGWAKKSLQIWHDGTTASSWNKEQTEQDDLIGIDLQYLLQLSTYLLIISIESASLIRISYEATKKAIENGF